MLYENIVVTHIKSYECIRQAIMLVIQDGENIEGVTKALYPKIVKTFNTLLTRVKRATMYAIEVAWKRASIYG